MSTDGGFWRRVLKPHLDELVRRGSIIHHQRIENSLEAGMPDVELCWAPGTSLWSELKAFRRLVTQDAYTARFREAQVTWLNRRTRVDPGSCVILGRASSGEIVVYHWHRDPVRVAETRQRFTVGDPGLRVYHRETAFARILQEMFETREAVLE